MIAEQPNTYQAPARQVKTRLSFASSPRLTGTLAANNFGLYALRMRAPRSPPMQESR